MTKTKKDTKNVQKIFKHSSVTITVCYLQSLGLLDDENAVSMLPDK